MKAIHSLLILFCLIPFLLPAEEISAEAKSAFIKKIERMGMSNITETSIPSWVLGSMRATATQREGEKLILLDTPSDVGEITTKDFVFRGVEFPILASVKGQQKNLKRIVCLLTKESIISVMEVFDDPGTRLFVTVYPLNNAAPLNLYLR